MRTIQTLDAGKLGGFQKGLGLHRESIGFLWSHRSLWPLAAVPALLSLLSFAGVGLVVVSYADVLGGLTSSWLPILEVATWYEWFWIGPAKAGLWLMSGLFFLLAVALLFLLGFLVANILAAPFLDLLSQRVEALVKGKSEDPGEGFWDAVKELNRSVFEEIRRTGAFLVLQAGVLMLGLIPGGQIIALPLSIAITIFFLTLDMASYALDRRRFSFAEKKRWLSTNRYSVTAFGTVAMFACAVPVVNFFAMPWFVTGGTLFVLRSCPDDEVPGTGPGKALDEGLGEGEAEEESGDRLSDPGF
ncbi:MAG: EI24 domain-containing protein [Deltaproteobacteria bacterium]|nr:EI24 domain-containing protein [Deltaproteobacteria bacterium]